MDEPVARYFDKQFQVEAAKILPGQYHAAADDILIVTVLGTKNASSTGTKVVVDAFVVHS